MPFFITLSIPILRPIKLQSVMQQLANFSTAVSTFRKGAPIRTSFNCPGYCARIGRVLSGNDETHIYEVQLNALEKGGQNETALIHANFLSLRQV